MKKVAFEWYELQGEMKLVPVLGCTGLLVIPGCEQTTDNPQGGTITFEGQEYRNYSIDPMGAIILGNDGVYSDKLSQDKLLPTTEFPRICPFLQYQQVTGCGGTGIWAFLTDNKWIVCWNRTQRVDYDGSGKRPFLYYQLIYDYKNKSFTFSYREAETSPDATRPTRSGSISSKSVSLEALDLNTMFKDVSYRLGEVDVPPVDPPIKPPVDPSPASWVTVATWKDLGTEYRTQRKVV